MAKKKSQMENEENIENKIDENEVSPQIELTSEGLGTQAMFSYGLGESLVMEDLDQRIFYIDGEIDENIFREINVFIMKFNAVDTGLSAKERLPIKLVISSGGGNVLDGIGTINCIRNSTTPIIAICTSYACSMAFHIFASAHIRIATSDTVFLNHDGEMHIGNSTSKTEDTITFHQKINERLNKILVSRSKFTMKELADTKRIENWYFGDEARDLGIVDAIIGEDVSFEDIFSHGYPCDCEESQES